MIHVKVLQADNLPVLNKKSRKTRIYCFSSSSSHYFYGSFKSKESTTNPQWHGEFDADLFRCSKLTFLLYSSRLLSHEEFLGRVDVDIVDFFQQKSGKKILSSDNDSLGCSFPITSCSSSNASLILSFSYNQIDYPPMNSHSIPDPIIHLWPTFSLSDQNIPIEVELLQAYFVKGKKNGLNGLYYNFNTQTSWESVGSSSLNTYIFNPTGPSQIHTFSPHRIDSKYEFFIVNNNSNFKGVVTLNFLCEREGSQKIVKNQRFILPHEKHTKNGIMKTVDVNCEPNTKILAPILMYCQCKSFKNDKIEFATIPSIKSDISDSSSNFCADVIEKAKATVNKFNNVTFHQTNVMNNNEKHSLIKIFTDLNLRICFNLRIYIGGLYEHKDREGSRKYYWEMQFAVFDKETLLRCHEIEKSLTKKPNLVSPILNNGKPLYGMKWNSYVNLNLDKIDMNKVILFIIHCDASLESATTDGFYLISQMDGDTESLLFRNMVFVDKKHSHYLVCFRLEFVDDGWEIFPMRYHFAKKKKMNPVIDSLFANNWVLPDALVNPVNPRNFISEEEEEEEEEAEIIENNEL